RTDEGLRSHIAKIVPTFKETAPAAITFAQAQEWVAGLGLSPTSTGAYLSTLRAVLDFAGVDPNPARDPRIRLPRRQTVTVEPPSAKDVEAILANITAPLAAAAPGARAHRPPRQRGRSTRM